MVLLSDNEESRGEAPFFSDGDPSDEDEISGDFSIFFKKKGKNNAKIIANFEKYYFDILQYFFPISALIKKWHRFPHMPTKIEHIAKKIECFKHKIDYMIYAHREI